MNSPVITLLTRKPHHPAVERIVAACSEAGLELSPSRAIDIRSVAVWPWDADRLVPISAIRKFCACNAIELINPRRVGRLEQQAHAARLGFAAPGADSGFSAEGAGTPHRYMARLLIAGPSVVDRQLTVTKTVRERYGGGGQRVRRLPMPAGSRLEDLVLELCAGLGVDAASVEVALTPSGPVLLDVGHRRPDFASEAFDPPSALRALARYVLNRAAGRSPGHPLAGAHGVEDADEITVVAEQPWDATLEVFRQACRDHGFSVRVDANAGDRSSAVVRWGKGSLQLSRAAERARVLSMVVVNGRARPLIEQRGRLHEYRVRVPRFRRVHSLQQARRQASLVGYPLCLRYDAASGGTAMRLIGNELQLALAVTDDRECVIEEARWRMWRSIRVWVVCGAAFAAWERTPDGTLAAGEAPRWVITSLSEPHGRVARDACQALELDFGIVDMVLDPEGPTVMRVLERFPIAEEVARDRIVEGCEVLARAIRRRVDAVRRRAAARAPEPPNPLLRVVLPRPLSGHGSGLRNWHIHAMYQELRRRGHSIVVMKNRHDVRAIHQADVVLQDPLHALGPFGRRDAINWHLVKQAPEISHLLRSRLKHRTGKRQMWRLARLLHLRAPEVYRRHRLADVSFPVIVKPDAGSLGRGVKLVRSLTELRHAASRSDIVQQYISPGIPYAVNLRIITMADTVVTAGLFYHRDAVCANLSRGGRAIALTGPGRAARLSPEEVRILEAVRIDPVMRGIPDDVRHMCTRVGEHYGRRGVQILGQDYVVDAEGRWYFLEVNTAFGLAVFNVTHGEGFPSGGRGYRHAGRVLAQHLVAVFGDGQRRRE